MEEETKKQKIREYAFQLWQEAGSPEGRELDFWKTAEEKLAQADHTPLTTDDTSDQSFPASDPVNHM